MRTLLLYIMLSVASYRTWRFIGKDDITEFARKPLPSYLRKGVECPFCFGTWVALFGTYLFHRYVTTLSPHWLLWAVAVAGAVGLLGFIDEKLST